MGNLENQVLLEKTTQSPIHESLKTLKIELIILTD